MQLGLIMMMSDLANGTLDLLAAAEQDQRELVRDRTLQVTWSAKKKWVHECRACME